MDGRPFIALALVGAGALAGVALERAGGPPDVRPVPEATGIAPDAALERFRASLNAAQADVTRMETALRDAEERLAAARAERDRAVDARGRSGRLVRALEVDVEALRDELDGASARRDELLLALADTAQALQREVAAVEALSAEVDGWREATTVTAWAGFVAEAKVSLCDRGTRKRHARCHETVEAALGPDLRARFETCVATGQAHPALVQADADEGLPRHAVWVEQDNRFISGDWYVLLCDPSLPEAAEAQGGSADAV